jgi:hypothetical protein
MNRILLLLLFVVSTFVMVAGQTTAPAPATDAPKVSAKDDISGMYSFLKDGEFVQINQEDAGQLSGFVSRFGDDDTDKKLFLDQFFNKGSLAGNKVTFTTKVVHGTWFEFAGTVERGPGKNPSDEAYRLIKGKLTRHKSDNNGKDVAESRELEMKSFPADMDED